MALIFYTTSHCGLCEQAEAILLSTPLPTPIPVEVIDIAESAALVDAYGTRIPVLKRTDTGAELGWPFDAQQVQQFLS